jgi:PAS domain S-box-containing protein
MFEQSDQELQACRNLLLDFMSNSLQGILIVDSRGTISFVNPAAADIFGCKAEELQGRQFEFSLQPGVTSKLDVKSRDGKTAAVEMRAMETEWDAEKVYFVTLRDVTGCKKMEEALRDSEERFRATFNQAAVGIAHIDPDGRWLRINQKFCEIVGYTEEELKGLTVLDITHPHDVEASHKHLQLLLDGKLGSYSLEKRYIRKDGSTVWVNLNVSVVSDPAGMHRYLVGVIEDITARKRAEEEVEVLNTDLAARAAELEAINMELEAFSHTVSHDLRTHLSNIGGYSQVVLELCAERLDEQCTGYLKEIFRGTERMNQLIGTILNFSRLTRGGMEREAVNLSEMAKEIAAEMRLKQPEREVKFTFAEGVMVNGDPKLLRVVMENLLGNAWKYTSRQKAGVIEFGAVEVEGKRACFVRDNGIGFGMANSGKLFTPFQRLPGADEFKGHGIGLATVQRIIRRHGGRVWAEGEAGKGATFFFLLP